MVQGPGLPSGPEGAARLARAAFARTTGDPDSLIDALLAEFRPAEQPLRANQDFALRYFHPVDVQDWSSFLLRVLPRVAEQLQR